MSNTFKGITLLNTSKQLNVSMPAIRKDLQYALCCLSNNNLISRLKQIFNDVIDLKLLLNDNFKLSLSHLFALMFYYKYSIQLTHISKLKDNIIDINIWSIFVKANKNNKYKICEKILNHINKIKESSQNPILLFYGDSNLNNQQNTICFKEIAVVNNIKWTKCKTQITNALLLSNDKEKSMSISHTKAHRKQCMRIPKKILPAYHNKNYHSFGRRHNLPLISLHEMGKHAHTDSCWIIVNGLVLDVTSFLPFHPAGKQCIIANGGKICDQHFKFHSKNAQKLFFKFVIGRIEKQNRCIIQ